MECDFHAYKLSELIFHHQQNHQKSTLHYNCGQYRGHLTEVYLKTKFVFGNGLVLIKQSLIGTKFRWIQKIVACFDSKREERFFRAGSMTSDNLSDVSYKWFVIGWVRTEEIEFNSTYQWHSINEWWEFICDFSGFMSEIGLSDRIPRYCSGLSQHINKNHCGFS